MASRYDDLDRPPLRDDDLRHALVTAGSAWSELEVAESVPSTNAQLAKRATTDARSGLILIAEHQSAGRGRLDRSWEAPARSALTMSVLVRPEVPAPQWPWLPLLAGLATAAALRRNAGVDAVLKWPNDVLIGDRKVAGVLVERVEAGPHPPAAVIGIGINVSLSASELPVPSATSLVLEDADTTDRSVLARAVLRALEGLLADWQRAAGEAAGGLRAAYTEACSTLGRRVLVSLPGGENLEGDAVEVDGSGRLVVQTAAGRQPVAAGDVLHVRSTT